MTVIACLQLPPKNINDGGTDGVTDSVTGDVNRAVDGVGTEISGDAAVLDVCAQLTPVVEPDGDRIWMDWTGCGSVPSLMEKLASGLARLHDTNGATAASSRRSVRYRLGVAPLRFVAGALAGEGTPGASAIDTPVITGFWVTDDALPSLLTELRVRALAELDAEIRDTLQALDVRTLGELTRFPRDLLYSHIGRIADELLDWARGRDERRVQALYPPERLERRISTEKLGLFGVGAMADVRRMRAVIFDVAAELAAELEASRRACAALTVAAGEQRLERSFTSPITAPDQLGRVAWQLVQRLLADAPPLHNVTDDCSIVITPTRHAGKQTTLFAHERLGAQGERKPNVLEHPALAAVRARFGHLFRFHARAEEANRRSETGSGKDETGHYKASVARYEAMCRFYA